MSKAPAFQFYTGDWLKDPNLGRCSKAAKGFWIDCLAHLWDCPVRGKFCDSDGRPWSDDEIAYLVGGDLQENLRLLSELIVKRVTYRDEGGSVYSKRMVEDESKRVGNKERQHDFRESQKSNGLSNTDITHHITPLSEEEDEVEEVLVKASVEEIWKLYPRKVNARDGKASIRRAIDREIPVMEPKGATDYLKLQTEKYFKAVGPHITDETLKFVPHASTFFNQSRYNLPMNEWLAPFRNGKAPPTVIPSSAFKSTSEKMLEKYGDRDGPRTTVKPIAGG